MQPHLVNDSTNIIVSSSEGTGGTAIICLMTKPPFSAQSMHLGYQELSKLSAATYDMPISQA